jgi:peptidoglycan/LPS O-acetylase OafA/YrhL
LVATTSLVPPPGAASRRGLPYLPGLDGLRALSVLAVVGYHAELSGLSGGFLGVEVFFVLSGYLITALLLVEREDRGWIDLGAFWRRRARRLLPAVAVMLAAVSAGALLFWRDALDQLRGDLVAAVFYVSNWWQIVEDRSYFESTGRPPMLQHLWSLAVEEQFYVLFPLVLALGLAAARHRHRAVSVGFVAVALASAWWMAILHEPYTDPSRVYYGTDTRLSGLLLGAALAFVVVPGPGGRSDRTTRTATDALGLAGLAVLAWAFVSINEFDPFVYQGGFVLVDAATLAVIVAVARTDGRLGRLLGTEPLRWVGTRSYAIYLWHWPVVVVTRPELDVPLDGAPLLALRVALTLILAEASYRFVEHPIRTGELQLWRPRRIMHARPGRIRYALPVVAVATLPVIAVVAGVGGDRTGAADDVELVAAAPTTATPSTVPSPPADPMPATAAARPDGTAVDAATTGEPPTTTAATSAAAPAATPGPPPTVLALGDSVMLGARPALEAAIPGVVVDAGVARQLGDGAASLRWWMSETDGFDVVVVHLGTNGAFGDDQLDELVAAARPAEVVLLEASAPRPWIPLVNERLASGAERHDAELVRWRDAVDAAGGTESDGIHLPPSAAAAYASVVADAVTTAAG